MCSRKIRCSGQFDGLNIPRSRRQQQTRRSRHTLAVENWLLVVNAVCPQDLDLPIPHSGYSAPGNTARHSHCSIPFNVQIEACLFSWHCFCLSAIIHTREPLRGTDNTFTSPKCKNSIWRRLDSAQPKEIGRKRSWQRVDTLYHSSSLSLTFLSGLESMTSILLIAISRMPLPFFPCLVLDL